MVVVTGWGSVRPPVFDLRSHSTYSDGECPLEGSYRQRPPWVSSFSRWATTTLSPTWTQRRRWRGWRWTHPFWDLDFEAKLLEALDRYSGWGLDGVEAFYPSHTAQQTRLLADRCRRLGLLTTGSADFHGPSHRLFNRFLAFDRPAASRGWGG